MNKVVSLCFVFFLFLNVVSAQKEATYKVGAIGFYNFENLCDIEDDPDIKDEEFTPTGGKQYTAALYQEKQDHLARVVKEIATDVTPDGLALLGVSEVENRKVLEDFVKNPQIKDRNYQIVHFDSPDERGIDVGLLYNPKYFSVDTAVTYPLVIYRGEERDYTRDVLLVSGQFDGEPIHVLVNHWPSRGGGA